MGGKEKLKKGIAGKKVGACVDGRGETDLGGRGVTAIQVVVHKMSFI